jgi:asparagine synthase (glutamine-hydrolysing)
LKVYLPNDPLVKVDRMSMAHSLEVRSPLLDRKVIELAFRIPAAQKQRAMQGKVLLRALAKQRLPGKLWRLPKRGFTAPIGEWIAKPYAQMFEEEVLRPGAAISTHVDLKDVQRLFRQHVRGEADHGYALWAVWVLERWLQAASESGRTRLDAVAAGL